VAFPRLPNFSQHRLEEKFRASLFLLYYLEAVQPFSVARNQVDTLVARVVVGSCVSTWLGGHFSVAGIISGSGCAVSKVVPPTAATEAYARQSKMKQNTVELRLIRSGLISKLVDVQLPSKKLQKIMKQFSIAMVMGVCCVIATPLLADTSAERLTESSTVLTEIMNAPDKGIPRDLLEKANCIIVVPGVKKAAFVVGAKYGKGFMACRQKGDSGWGAPASVRMEGGSFGFQIGGSETDVVMLLMDASGRRSLLSSKFVLGGDASVAGGPVGRSSSAETDAQMKAKILSYSRSRGAFAGIALTGATLRQDLSDNQELYGQPLTNKKIIEEGVAPPAATAGFIDTLNKLSRHEQK
jgi:lipid-binding SYLF domain-containing protein